ncbi:hypothetical protein ES707_20181 [subsurface metagenome]
MTIVSGETVKTNKTLLSIILFLIILFMFLGGCKSLSLEDVTKEKGKEITEEPTEEVTNEKEDKDEKEYVITEPEYFEMPDEIILYNKGEHIIVKKNTESYNKITYITNERFKTECGLLKEIISDEFIEDIKSNKFAIEFIYNKEIKTVYTCEEWRFEKNYTKILFPLPDFRAIFGPYKGEYQEYQYQAGPWRISIQPESNYLIAIIEEEFSK